MKPIFSSVVLGSALLEFIITNASNEHEQIKSEFCFVRPNKCHSMRFGMSAISIFFLLSTCWYNSAERAEALYHAVVFAIDSNHRDFSCSKPLHSVWANDVQEAISSAGNTTVKWRNHVTNWLQTPNASRLFSPSMARFPHRPVAYWEPPETPIEWHGIEKFTIVARGYGPIKWAIINARDCINEKLITLLTMAIKLARFVPFILIFTQLFSGRCWFVSSVWWLLFEINALFLHVSTAVI